MSLKTISVFEHERLAIGEARTTLEGGDFTLTPGHFDALVELNDRCAQRFLSVGHRHLRFSQYVGFVQVGELGVEILPKADRRSGGQTPWRDALLDMLRVAGKLRLVHPSTAQLGLRRASLLEIHVASFLDHCEGLQREGLARGYRRIRGNRTVFRGRLVCAEHIRRNLVHAERAYTEHPVYDHEIVVNQGLASALRVLERTSLHHRLRARVDRCLGAMPPELGSLPSLEALDRVVLDRSKTRYREALALARLILTQRALTLQRGSSSALALLFDMNALWERYVLELLRSVAPPRLRVEGQATRVFWRPRDTSAKTRSVRPDIVIRERESGRVLAVLDTKWKLIDAQAAIADLGQMFIYNELLASPRSLLVYPGVGRETKVQEGRFAGGAHDCAQVSLSLMAAQGFTPAFARSQAGALLQLATEGAALGFTTGC